jgi:hypothetical protein
VISVSPGYVFLILSSFCVLIQTPKRPREDTPEPFSCDEEEEEAEKSEEAQDIPSGIRNEVVCTYVWLICFVAMKFQ